MNEILTKVAAERRRYYLRYADFQEIVAGETVTNIAIPSVSGLTIETPATNHPVEKEVRVWISGGTAKQRYTIDCNLTTNAGSVLTIRFFLDVI